MFGAGRLDGRTLDAVARVIVDQARQSIPGIAKKVINEWTTSLVGASKARTAKQKSAAARVDIASGNASAGRGRRGLMPRDMDYRRAIGCGYFEFVGRDENEKLTIRKSTISGRLK